MCPTRSGFANSNKPIARAAAYLRVSTGRQAETDLSIPDQRRQIEAWAVSRGYVLAEVFTEAGASATDDKRPEFQRMIDRICDGGMRVDVIIVHSYSRFFRDSFGLEFYLRRMAKHGVKLISITQELDEDEPAQGMMRKVIALFDEYQSKENAKHVLRAMKENARQGFWNGAKPPFGYRLVEVERRGARVKKRLEIDVVESETVRLIFKLFMDGVDGSGPMGVKAITSWLNANGYHTRGGAAWGVGPIHALLTHPVYSGRMRFNHNEARTRRRKSEGEQVFADVPGIIEVAMFAKVQERLHERNPRVTPPRVVTGPILLTGLAACATCGGAMTLRTGTSRSGVVHRYYACSQAIRTGKATCKGRSIRMDLLDGLVTDHMVKRLLAKERLRAMLEGLAGRRAALAASVDERVAKLDGEASAADDRLRRLYRLVEEGDAEPDELLKGRLEILRRDRDHARAAADRARISVKPPHLITDEMIARFGTTMCDRLTTGEVAFRKAYFGAIVDKIEVDDTHIRIIGQKDALEAAIAGQGGTVPPVRSFVRKWRTRQDSNL